MMLESKASSEMVELIMNVITKLTKSLEGAVPAQRCAAFFSVILCFALILPGCSGFKNMPLASPISVSGFKLNTYVEIKGYDTGATEQILNEALALCDRYETMFSRTLDTGSLAELNKNKRGTVPEELGELIQYGIDCGDMSDGAFDISIGAVSSLWDFTSDDHKLPDAGALRGAVASIGYKNIYLEKNADQTYNVTIPEDMILDLGALAKGYIADKIKEYLLANGVKSALINLGGNVLCVGSKPGGEGYSVSVRKPFGEASDYLCRLNIADMSVVSSGTYERCFTLDGRLYHHILNPSTGYPYDNELAQVTIISEDSMTGDGLSTVCFTLGLEKGLALIENIDGAEAIFVTDDNTVYYSSGAEQYVTYS